MKTNYTQTNTKFISILILTILMLLYFPSGYAETSAKKLYVGSKACQDCHEKEYKNFVAYANKSKSYESIKVMQKGLTDSERKGCLVCHTTGYGAPGGFVSETKTPQLKNAGCEVCHGPGSIHIESEDPEDINAEPTVEVCSKCHTQERVAAFRSKPLLFGGAH